MNSRKIKTSRTFYGKSGVSDPLAPFASPPYPASTPLCRGVSPEVSQKKNRWICGKNAEPIGQF